MNKIVLASSSPRRRELLTRSGIRFTVVEPDAEMAAPPGMCADLAVQLVARQKAVSVAAKVETGTFVLAADTVVVGPRGVMGKPGTPERARSMLQELRGGRHTVMTGVCAILAPDQAEALAMSRSTVNMKDFSDEELMAYIASGEPLDKAGAYAAQGGAADFIINISGRIDTVVGLDVSLAHRLLAEIGYPDPLPATTDIPLRSRIVRRPLSPLRHKARV